MALKLFAVLLILNLAQGSIAVNVADIQFCHSCKIKDFFLKILIKNFKDKNISINIRFEAESDVHHRWNWYYVSPSELNLTLGPRVLREITVRLHVSVTTMYDLYMIVNGHRILLYHGGPPVSDDVEDDPKPYLEAYGAMALLAVMLSYISRGIKRKKLR